MHAVRAIVLIFAAMTAASGVAGANQPTVITAGTTHALADAGLVIAHRRGYFRAEGLDVRLVSFDHPAKMAAPLATGQLAVAGAALTPALIEQITRPDARAQIVADKGSAPAGHGFMPVMVRKDLLDSGKVKALKDLKGLRIGHAKPDDGGARIVGEAIKKAGLKPADMKPIGISAQRLIPALANRSIDAAVLREPAATLAMRSGDAALLLGDDQLMPGRQAEVLVFSAQLVAATPGAAMRFAKGYLRGVREYNDALLKGRLTGPGSAAVTGFLADHLGLADPRILNLVIPPALNPDGRINETSLKAELKLLTASGEISAGSAPEKLIDHRYVDWAAKQLGPYIKPK
jgi:NitT/TauT family transport system substrate-binding protein